MAIFAIIPQPNINTSKLSQAVADAFPNAFYVLEGNSGFLVSAAKATPKEISDKLHITDGQNGAALVVEIAAYFGRANPNVWSWIKANWETAQSG
jgi:hypothetical protein